MEVNAQFEMTDLCCAWQWGKRTDCTDSVQCIVVEFDITGARRHLAMADAPICSIENWIVTSACLFCDVLADVRTILSRLCRTFCVTSARYTPNSPLIG